MARRIRSCRRSLALTIGALLVAVAVCSPVAAQAPFDYNRLVGAYSTGHLDEAVSQLSRWPGDHIRNAVDAFVKATQARTAADGSLLPAPLLPGAVMLHTDLAAALLGDDFPRAESHIGLARRLVDLLAERSRKDDRAREFVTRWYEFAPTMYLLHQNPDKAFLLVQEGLTRAPDNPTLHLYSGIVIEMTVPRPAAFDTRARPLTPTPSRAEPLEPAAREYRIALKADGRLAVARLHLGRVHFIQHDSRARADLEQALADATDVSTRYLAHLFLGDLAEREKRPADALREYEAAMTAGPLYQTAYVAAGRMADALGQSAHAREIAIAFVGIEKHEDPWWEYRLGGLNMPALEWLRRAAQAP
jgi:tetratricopeptide (TPR) repeat protein